MKILFLDKEPKKCAHLHNDEQLRIKIPVYCRLIGKSLQLKHNMVLFNEVTASDNDRKCETIKWLLTSISHRSWMIDLLRNCLKEYDKRTISGAFLKQRRILNEIACWGDYKNIDWTGTNFEHDSKMVH